MTPENFCYWLQGYIEIGRPMVLDARGLEEVKNHLNLVFKKETPDLGVTEAIKTQEQSYCFAEPPIHTLGLEEPTKENMEAFLRC